LNEIHTRKQEAILPPAFWFRKAVRASFEDLKDQNKNEKNIDKERKNVLQ